MSLPRIIVSLVLMYETPTVNRRKRSMSSLTSYPSTSLVVPTFDVYPSRRISKRMVPTGPIVMTIHGVNRFHL